jgi:hypothetical protein
MSSDTMTPTAPHSPQPSPDWIKVPNIAVTAMKAVSVIEALPNAESRTLGFAVLESNLRTGLEAIRRARLREAGK